ncbi:hypothetical protein CPB84DRAFT_1752318 [Gymnopilus junonius]|uniref:Uncharacterized protein n=1 Tax=Gymnopilus junonius TaxID=109634 RepID=A0A9P5NDF1_GYMJU|nr:hypothetical protein CPB84DRAFT_1752318 [Gymnopilus junonius]
MHLHFASQSPSQSASAIPIVLATPAAIPATVPPSAPAMQAMSFAAASVGPAAAPEQANSADPQPESHNVADDEMDTHPDNFAILRSYSSEIAPPPDMLVDPRVAGDMFVGILICGRPVGLVLDINLFFEILRTQSDVWYHIFFNWREAYGYYQAQYSNGLVQITPLLKAPLPTLLPGASKESAIMVPSTAPTPAPTRVLPRNRRRDTIVTALVQSNHPAIDPFLSTPTALVEAAASFLIHRSGSGSGLDEGSDGSSDGSPEEEDNGDVKAGKGKQKAVLVTREDDPALAHIPAYPKFPSSTILARLMTPHLDLTAAQTAPTTASDP